MVRVENHCCDCPVCRGLSCPNRNVEVHYCDHCTEYMEDFFEVDGEELCANCYRKKCVDEEQTI